MTSFRNVPSPRLRYVTSDVKLLAVLFLVFGLLVPSLGAGAIESETAPDVRRHIQQRLEKSSNEPVAELYALAGFEPLWYGTAGARIARHALLAEIGRRPLYGLSVDPPCAAGYGEDKTPIAQAAADNRINKMTFAEWLEEDRARVVNNVKVKTLKNGLKAKLAVRSGDPASVVQTFAEEHKCSEIVMGTRGLGPVKGLFLGSTTMKLVQLVNVPVTLVK